MEHKQSTFSAPALARGIAVLRLLEDGRRMTLEAIAGSTSLPKPSLLRILQTLDGLGLVARDTTSRHYYATSRLVPFQGNGRLFEGRLDAALERIASATGHTAEWYVPSEDGMALVRRAEPSLREVGVQARIGFIRSWKGELDAVATVAYAWLREPMRSFAGFWSYVADGMKDKLSDDDAKRCVGQARQNGFAVDKHCNLNGVRRIACIVGRNAKCLGVLVVAQHLVPPGLQRERKHVEVLLKEAQNLSENMTLPFTSRTIES